jgi:DNA-binding transcriptional LysR family regulator
MPHDAHDAPNAGDMQDMAVALEELTERLGELLQEIESLRDDLSWAVRQLLADGRYTLAAPITSMPLDPLAPDFGARLNKYDARSLPDESPPPPADAKPTAPEPPAVAPVQPPSSQPGRKRPSLFD